MPKIIKDLDKKILKTAEELFKEKGYEDVDMRLIARTIGIAVGTLYNYYSSKYVLYVEVLKRSWENTVSSIEKINIMDIEIDEKLYKIIEKLYIDLEKRNGLGNVLFRESYKVKTDNPKDIIKGIKENIFVIVKNTLKEGIKSGKFNIDNWALGKFAIDLFLLCVSLRSFGDGNREDNLKYLRYRIDMICK